MFLSISIIINIFFTILKYSLLQTLCNNYLFDFYRSLFLSPSFTSLSFTSSLLIIPSLSYLSLQYPTLSHFNSYCLLQIQTSRKPRPTNISLNFADMVSALEVLFCYSLYDFGCILINFIYQVGRFYIIVLLLSL